MRVAVVAGFAPSLLNFRKPFLQALIAAGHSVTAIAPEFSSEVHAAVEALGVSPRAVPFARTGVNPIEAMRSQRAMRHVLAECRCDAVVAYTMKAIALAMPAARGLAVPHRVALVTGLGTGFHGRSLLGRMVRVPVQAAVRRALRSSTDVVFQNADDRAMLGVRPWIGKHTRVHEVAGSGVNLSHYTPTPAPDAPHVLMLSRLVREKGVREFVEAAAKVKQERPDTVFRLAGMPEPAHPTGISMQEVDRWVDAGWIEYLGDLDDVRPAMDWCRVYVLPSYAEGRPRTVQEALACGRPVITTDVPGCRDAIDTPTHGRIVPPRDASSLAEAILEVLDTDMHAMGSACRALAESRYSDTQIAASLVAIVDG
ncbi:MAG: glycosyltransferase family 4 protein [Phycisphaerales bacterium]|nr:glycosyltransferase family 4 protein [Phycisphaerales bacterium]